jgi:signal transduction histidine kinase
VREIALQHGASVALTETPGGGLTMTVELPRAADRR